MNPGRPKTSRRAPLAKRHPMGDARGPTELRTASLGAFREECDAAIVAIKIVFADVVIKTILDQVDAYNCLLSKIIFIKA